MKENKNKTIFKSKSEAGKGDRPRNISKNYYNNFDEIDWSAHKKNPKEKN
jgi:hypothetical protein